MKMIFVIFCILLSFASFSYSENYNWDDKQAVDRMAKTLDNLQESNNRTYNRGSESSPAEELIWSLGFLGVVLFFNRKG